MNKLKAILFDYDGVIRDTRKLIYESYEHAFKQNGLTPPTKDELAPHIHHHSFVHKALVNNISYEQFEGVYREKVNELLPSVGVYEGVLETLAVLRGQGYKIGLVTAARQASEDLERLGIADYFDTVVGASDITNHKPHPEGVLLALERLEVSPDEAVMVGDMPTDIKAAKDAKLKATIGITTGLAPRYDLEAAECDYVIDSLRELPKILQ